MAKTIKIAQVHALYPAFPPGAWPHCPGDALKAAGMSVPPITRALTRSSRTREQMWDRSKGWAPVGMVLMCSRARRAESLAKSRMGRGGRAGHCSCLKTKEERNVYVYLYVP